MGKNFRKFISIILLSFLAVNSAGLSCSDIEFSKDTLNCALYTCSSIAQHYLKMTEVSISVLANLANKNRTQITISNKTTKNSSNLPAKQPKKPQNDLISLSSSNLKKSINHKTKVFNSFDKKHHRHVPFENKPLEQSFFIDSNTLDFRISFLLFILLGILSLPRSGINDIFNNFSQYKKTDWICHPISFFITWGQTPAFFEFNI